MKKVTIFLSVFCLCGALFAQEAVVDVPPIPTDSVGIQDVIPTDVVGIDEVSPTDEVGDIVASEQQFAEEAAVEPEPAQVPAVSSGKPKIAVYVTGGKDVAENKALGTYILEALVRSDRYVAIERSELFLAEIDNEQIRQRSGAIDDAQISALGKQSGVAYVCVADITHALRGAQISARVLDVETAAVAAVGTAEGRLASMEDLRRVSVDVVCVMLGIEPPRVRRVSFAARVAYNNSYVSKYTMSNKVYQNGENAGFVYQNAANEMGAGSGFEVGVSTIIGLTPALAAEVGAVYAWRKPVSVEGMFDITESAVIIPALLRGYLFKSPFFLQGGVQLEVPFGVSQEPASGEEINRRSADAGLVIGGGYRIGKNMAADIRAVHGTGSYDGQNDHLLYQVTAGFSYVY